MTTGKADGGPVNLGHPSFHSGSVVRLFHQIVLLSFQLFSDLAILQHCFPLFPPVRNLLSCSVTGTEPFCSLFFAVLFASQKLPPPPTRFSVAQPFSQTFFETI